jgi:hypothetical protein
VLITVPSKEKNEKREWVFLWVLLALFCVGFVMVYFGTSHPSEEIPAFGRVRSKVEFDLIGFGPMALNGLKTPCPVQGLNTELVLVGRNTRPDAQNREGQIQIALRSAAQEKKISVGDEFFLERGPGGVISFAEGKSDLKASVFLTGDKPAIRIQTKDQEGTFLLSEITTVPMQETYVQALRESKGYGRDLFLNNFSGSEYAVYKTKSKIDFGKEVLFVEPGDSLVWDENTWTLSRESKGQPLAVVKAVSNAGLEMEVWDVSGYHSNVIKIPFQSGAGISFKIEEILAVRPRSSTEISCLLGKRRVVVREGDWWLKSEHGWKKVRTLSDMEDVLYHKQRGELVVFESIVAEKGKVAMKGNVFDVMRSKMAPLVMSVAIEKKKPPTKTQNPPPIVNREVKKK